MAGKIVRPSAGASTHPQLDTGDPLADLARLVVDERGGRPGRAAEEDGTFGLEEDLALRGSLADGEADPAYPPEAYAGVPYDGDDHGATPDLRHRAGGVRLAALVIGLAVLGAGGVYGYRLVAHPHAVAGTPPVIKASTEPVKVAPKRTAEAKKDKLIYDRVTSDTTAPAHVVGSAEEPAERPVGVSDDSTRVVLPAPPAGMGTATAAPGSVASAVGADAVDARSVKTVAIEPDNNVVLPQMPPPLVHDDAPPPPPQQAAAQPGTHIDAATRAEAAAIMAAVADPKTPVTGTGVAAGLTLMPNDRTGIMTGGPEQAGSQPSPPPAPAAAPSPAAAPAQAAAPAPESSSPNLPPQTASAPVPLPQARPSDLRAVRAIGAPIQLTPSARTVAPPPRTASLGTAQPEAGAGDYMVQLSSQRSEADARVTFQRLQARYGQVLGHYQPVITPATLGDRGTFYRLRIGGFRTKDLAATVCENLKAAGGNCIVQAR